MMKRKMFLVAAVATAWQIAPAQDSIPVREFEEFVITATRSRQVAADAPRSVTVIDKEEIEVSGYQNVAELLSVQQGMSVIGSRGTPGSAQTLFTRGASGNQTVIMIDGVPLTDPSSTNRAVELSELSLANVERIEIVRGTQSTLYGSSAIGGVVNIITKGKEKEGFHVDTRLLGSVFGTGTSEFNGDAHINFSTKKGFYLNADVFNSSVHGLDATLDTVTDPNIFNVRDKDDFSKMDLQGALGFKNEKADVRATYKNVQQVADLDKGAFRDDDNYTMKLSRDLLTYRASYLFSDRFSLSLSGGYSQMLREAVDDSSVVDDSGTFDHSYASNTYSGFSADNEVQFNLQLKGLEVVAGAGMQSEAMNQKSYSYSKSMWGVYELKSDYDTLNPKADFINAYAQTTLNGSLISEKLSGLNLLTGVRFEQHSMFGNNFTYTFNPSLKIGHGTLIFGSYATGFNAPSLYELFAPEMNYISLITRGNSGLDPEESRAYEFGVKQGTWKVAYSVSIFKTKVRNAISYVYLWDGSIGIDTLGNDWMRDDYRGDTYINLGTQTNTGLEIKLAANLSEKVELRTNLCIVNGRLHYSNADIDTSATRGNHVQLFESGAFVSGDVDVNGLIRRSATANIALIYNPFPKLSLRLEGNHVGPRYDVFYDADLGPYGALGTSVVSDYTLLNFATLWHVNEHITLNFRINNFENKQYTEINGFSTKGRAFYLSVRFAF